MIKRLPAFTVCSLLSLLTVASAQVAPGRAEDEKAIRAVVAGLSEAWTAGDARAWAGAFTEDADFTVWNGLYVKGREAIEQGHRQLFGTIYKDTRHRMTVRSVRFLRDDIAVVHAEASVAKKGEDFPTSPQVVPLFVFVKDRGQWRIAVFQNTSVQPGGVPPSAESKPSAGTVPVGGGELYYEVRGEGPPLVLLHAGGMDSRMWDEQFESLSRHFRVVRYDLRGFGRSSKPEQPFHPVDDLHRLMQHLGIRRAALVGLSMGSGVALNFALEHPEMVEKLVLASMSGPPRNLPAQAQLAMPKGKSSFERLKDVSMPTLLIVGEKDATSAEMAERVVKEIPAARKIVIPNANHFPNSEQPDSFNRELMAFFKAN